MSCTPNDLAIIYACDIMRNEEGFRPWPYRCPKGIWTIGYGTTFPIGVMTDIFDKFEADGLLSSSPFYSERIEPEPFLITEPFANGMLIQIVRNDARLLFADPAMAEHSPERKAVLLSMVYQMGFSSFLGFRKMRAALSAKDYDNAAREMLDSKWAREDTPRRAKEHAAAMRSGVLLDSWLPPGRDLDDH